MAFIMEERDVDQHHHQSRFSAGPDHSTVVPGAEMTPSASPSIVVIVCSTNGRPLFQRQSDCKFRVFGDIILKVYFSGTTLSFLMVAHRLEKARKPFDNYTNHSCFVADWLGARISF